MSEFTPGPWSVEVLDDTTNIESKYQTVACDVSNCDAGLIAAAPQLLSACHQAFDAICRAISLGELRGAREILADAIDKAEGRS
jgi:hypothetical protein